MIEYLQIVEIRDKEPPELRQDVLNLNGTTLNCKDLVEKYNDVQEHVQNYVEDDCSAVSEPIWQLFQKDALGEWSLVPALGVLCSEVQQDDALVAIRLKLLLADECGNTNNNLPYFFFDLDLSDGSPSAGGTTSLTSPLAALLSWWAQHY